MLFEGVLVPVLASIYKSYRFGRLAFRDILAIFRGQATRLMSGRHALQGAVILMALLVANTNIRASAMTAVDVGDLDSKSVLEVMTDQSFMDEADLLDEDLIIDDRSAAIDQGYLDAEAIVSEAMPPADMLIEDDAGGDTMTVPEPFVSSVEGTDVMPGDTAATDGDSRTGVVEYVVEEGDTVAGIAEKFGLKPATLIAVNGLSSRAVIRVGMKLRVPPMDGIIYVVKSGDTIGSIARRLSSTVAEIMRANGIGEDGLIAVATEIMVPGGVLPTPARPTYTPRPSQSASYTVPKDADDSSVSAGQMLWPAGVRRISQYYRGSSHTGLDIAGPVGTPLYAAASGTVTTAVLGWNGGYGNMTIIDHGNGYLTRYGHQSRIYVSPGDWVRRGQVIGLMGNTGRSTGPHLHFEVMKGNTRNRVNPLYYIK